MNDLSVEVEQLGNDLRKLERDFASLAQRLERVEARAGVAEHAAIAQAPDSSREVETAVAVLAAAHAPSAEAGSLFAVLGRAMLGIAGAYVLRALAESRMIPSAAVAVVGILFAFLWLVWATRVRGGPRGTSLIYASTSALILAPMLWELTLRFDLLPATVAAGIVCAFVLTGFFLTRGRDLKPVMRVVSIAGAGLALAMASHALLPFAAAMILLVAVCEFVPGCDRLPEVAALFALVADALTWIMIYAYVGGPATLGAFPALSRGALLAPGLAIFFVSIVSIGINTLVRGQQMAVFATAQTLIAFVIAAASLADFAQPHGVMILGISCLVLAFACYGAVFGVFAGAVEKRNRNVFAAWAAALLLTGSYLCLPHWGLVALLGVAALLSVWRSRQLAWGMFAFYGMLFLLAASAASGLPGFVASAFAGTEMSGLTGSGCFIASCALLCAVLAHAHEGEGRVQQTLHLGFAALAVAVAMAFVVDGLAALTALRVVPEAHQLALIRTVVLCAAALLLVAAGGRWRRRELAWLGYAALGVVALKLAVEDLRHGHLAYIAASIFLVAFTLMAAPRMRQRERMAGQAQ